MGACFGRGVRTEHGRREQGRDRGRRPSILSDSTSSAVLSTKNKPLRQEKIRWKSDIALTEGQLKSKRDEFWDTAPAFEGKEEIWAALKAAAEFAESGDFESAQAFLDGAGISLPHGSLVECYDVLGTRYVIPVYCLSYPINLVTDSDRDSPADFSEPVKTSLSELNGKDIKIKVRISLTSKDVRMTVNTAETVISAKKRLHSTENMVEPSRQRWYFGGKLLGDKVKFEALNLTPGYVIQCVINPIEFGVLQEN